MNKATKAPDKFVHKLNKNTVLWRSSSTNNLQRNTFFARNYNNADQYKGKTRTFKPTKLLKLLKLNVGSLDWLVNQYKTNPERKKIIEAARNYSFPTIKKNTNETNMKTYVMGRFSNFDNGKMSSKSEKAIIAAIRDVGLDGYIIKRAVPVARMNNKSIAGSSVFRPELAIANAPKKIVRVPAPKPNSPSPTRTPGTPGTPGTPKAQRTPGTPPPTRKLRF